MKKDITADIAGRIPDGTEEGEEQEKTSDPSLEEVIHATLRLMPVMLQKIVEPYRKERPEDLTYLQTQALFVVKEEKSIRMTELGSVLNIKKQQLTPIVSRLVECGYVERRKDPADGRTIMISLTQKGREAADLVDKRLLAALSPDFEALSKNDLRELGRSAESLVSILSKMPDHRRGE